MPRRPAATAIKVRAIQARAFVKTRPGPIVVALLVFLAVILLVWFGVALTRADRGENAAALGSVVGGIVGAGGAVWAVFLMLSRQREEETIKVAAAVRTEVTTLVKYIIGAIEICQKIKAGMKVPRQDASYIIKNFSADPIIYPAVADRVGLLPQPHETTEFYMRLSESKAIVTALQMKTDPPGMMAPPQVLVTPENATALADSLLTAPATRIRNNPRRRPRST